MAFDDPVTARILAFLEEIGVPVEIGAVAADSFLPGMTVRRGVLRVDPERPFYPGDLLHEAGHIAVSDPEARGRDRVSDEPGEEMAAIAWSWAAAMAAGVAPTELFHEAGYRGGGGWLAENFSRGHYVGVPLLQWWGMTGSDYPRMARWLR